MPVGKGGPSSGGAPVPRVAGVPADTPGVVAFQAFRTTCGKYSQRLLGCWKPGIAPLNGGRFRGCGRESSEGVRTVKKLLVLVLVALGGFLVWRRLQQDRAELDLWDEATSAEN